MRTLVTENIYIFYINSCTINDSKKQKNVIKNLNTDSIFNREQTKSRNTWERGGGGTDQ